MSYRYMRIMVLFDLPTGTAAERRAYNRFRRYLLREGFMMMQESVYAKLALNPTAAGAVMEGVRRNKPPAGLVQMLSVTEKQFNAIECVVGEMKTELLDTDERMVVL